MYRPTGTNEYLAPVNLPRKSIKVNIVVLKTMKRLPIKNAIKLLLYRKMTKDTPATAQGIDQTCPGKNEYNTADISAFTLFVLKS